MADLIFATRNIHKTRELRRLLSPELAVSDLSTVPYVSPPLETGITFEENAALKAIGVSRQMNGLVVADDSGLEVDALNHAPGVYSARYAGQNATDRQNIDKVLHELSARQASQDSRSSRFCCVIALAREGKLLRTFSGIVEGKIVDPPRGSAGFGYDSVFQPNGSGLTFGEMTEEMKNGISHRAQAAAQLYEFLTTVRLLG